MGNIDVQELRDLNQHGLVDPLTHNWQPSFLDPLRRQLAKDFGPAWQVNDAAHRGQHFAEVEAVANYINHRLMLNIDKTLIMLAAYFHDLFAWSRHNHHLTSATWVRTTDYSLIAQLTPDAREAVAQGCEHHRASGIGFSFPSVFAELICSADRCWPGNLRGMVNRCIAGYSTRHPDAERAEILDHVVRHMREKFGIHGYARLPNMYLQTFGDIVEKRMQVFENLQIVNGEIIVEDLPFIAAL